MWAEMFATEYTTFIPFREELNRKNICQSLNAAVEMRRKKAVFLFF